MSLAELLLPWTSEGAEGAAGLLGGSTAQRGGENAKQGNSPHSLKGNMRRKMERAEGRDHTLTFI